MVDESVLTGESVPIEKELEEEVFGGTLLRAAKAIWKSAGQANKARWDGWQS